MEYLTILFLSISANLDLPEGLLESVCYVESKHDIKAIAYDDGSTHSYGLCQIKFNTAKELGFKGTETDLMKPHNNIFYAGKYLKTKLIKYNSVERALVAYNRGNAKGLTRSKYSDKVIKHWRNKNGKT